MMGAPILLDTCALLWLSSGLQPFSSIARERLRTASDLYFSPISAWEIAQKAEARALQLPVRPLEWMEGMILRYQLTEIPVSMEVLIHAAELPKHHKDPADRIILATALLNQLPVATGDRRFSAYGVEVVA